MAALLGMLIFAAGVKLYNLLSPTRLKLPQVIPIYSLSLAVVVVAVGVTGHSGFFSYLDQAVLFTAFALYFTLLYAVNAYSVSVQLLVDLERSQGTPEFREQAIDFLLELRLRNLMKVRLIREKKGVYELSPLGVLIAKAGTLSKRIFNVGPGG